MLFNTMINRNVQVGDDKEGHVYSQMIISAGLLFKAQNYTCIIFQDFHSMD